MPPFQRLIDLHGRDVHRFLVACVGGHDADDCYQETWVAALRAYPELESAAQLRGWLFTIAHHKALDLLRARSRRSRRHLEPGPDGTLPQPRRPAPAAAAPPPGPEHPELWQAVADLPPKQRTALALRFVVDADYRAIAAMMGTSEAAARRNVHEALTRLRREDLLDVH